MHQFRQLFPLYTGWNSTINVISRKDIGQLYLHHVLHSLSIAKVIQFKPGTNVLDVGTGGGFPGIPLAILFPDSQFHLVDSVKKKIKVVEDVIGSLQLKNATSEWTRAEDVAGKYHFVVSRAVCELETLFIRMREKISGEQFNSLKNGLLVLKGGDLTEEIESLRKAAHHAPCSVRQFAIRDFFEEDYFREKWVVHVEIAGSIAGFRKLHQCRNHPPCG
ncbi:MAG TPA: 16S rRNA (guanine(527)-N(7))-methyltransferase RsmG [Chitinophagales bacterium]|nr:16S rRNA (guanine(527)-N(7))-methyltransferase RsmG [Chitinophagales bacterium]